VGGIKSLGNYKIAETEHYEKKINSKKYSRLYQKIFRDVYPMLKRNPYFGANIKKLKGEYKDVYRFRTGDYRLFYKIEETIIFIIDIENRKDAYK
jgi:mRNA interferase RelE/StbE